MSVDEQNLYVLWLHRKERYSPRKFHSHTRVVIYVEGVQAGGMGCQPAVWFWLLSAECEAEWGWARSFHACGQGHVVISSSAK